MTWNLKTNLNHPPEKVRHIHMMGICGTGMASLAGLLKELGYYVTGSDQNVYPPMSHLLESLGIPVTQGYGPQNLDSGPDLVIVGNVITRKNPEAVALSKRMIPYLSFPQALRYYAIGNKKAIVVAGTHGKTTTTSLISWILESSGMDPGFMIGGIPKNFSRNFKLGQGDYFVVEGDEYDSAFFDKGPKFLHYNPWIGIITSIEFDHADIYRDLNHILESFKKFIKLFPKDGLLVVNGDDAKITSEAAAASCRVETYGSFENNQWHILEHSYEQGKTVLKIANEQLKEICLKTNLFGRHNLSNLLGAVAVAHRLKIDTAEISKALETFEGVKRRQEIIGEKSGVLIMDDFAHHPTAVKETVKAVKERYPHRRLIAVFEPRSNSSRRNIFQNEYASAFESADLVMVPEPAMVAGIPETERFSSQKLAIDLVKKGIPAQAFLNTTALLAALLKEVKNGDLALIMSNGGFDGLHHRLLEGL